MKQNPWLLAVLCTIFLNGAARADEAQSLEQLRNTVINLLEGLVQKGVLTREQAEAMVADAQAKAEATARAKAAQDAEEKGAVRVTYVPETVRKEISDQVRTELRPEVTNDVVAQAKAEKWGVPGALPPWVNNLTFFGDLRVRAQADEYAADNAVNSYLDFSAINSRGGIGRAGTAALLNTTEDRQRERIRMRFGVNAAITSGVTAGIRLTSGNLTDPVSTNQTLGLSGARYTVAIDQAYLRFDTNSHAEVPWLTVWAGRMPNPWYSTDLVWDSDLQFEGVATTVRMDFNGSQANPKNVYLTAGAFPLQEIELSTNDKWLYAGQFGVDWSWSPTFRTRLAFAYYYYDNITGILNEPDSSLLDYTAQLFLQKGNTLFDIRNDLDTSTNLFALAPKYELQDIMVGIDWSAFDLKMMLTGNYVTNVGYDRQDILRRTGTDVEKRATGYQVEFGVGSTEARFRGNWRAAIEYRYLERDAVVDAFTDSDFHLGGTDAKGYVLKGDWWFRDRTNLSLRYLSSSEIDGPPLGIDTLMLDVTGTF